MTRAAFWEVEKNGTVQFWMQVDGHAGFGTVNDPICTACSAISQGLIAALFEEGFHVQYAADEKAPALQMICTAQDSLEAERIDYMIRTARHSFELLAKNYPKNVCVSGEKPRMH